MESPSDLFRRVARAVAQAELEYGTVNEAARWEEEFYKAMAGLLFLPNSPTLMNAGTPSGQLSACFVLPVEDSLDSIFTALKQAALIQKSGGGTGFNFSQLRPRGDFIHSSGGQSSGPVSFMKIYDATTENIKQGGKRRGAKMGILNIDHPDIEAFIQVKMDEDALRNFNISVGMRDTFMEAVKHDAVWNLIHPVSKRVVKKVKAKKLWELIVRCAWQHGDPGLIFLDAIHKNNPLPALGEIIATNPCAEMPLLPYESCNLGSINLARMVYKKKGKFEIDWQKIQSTITLATRFLDNVIDVNYYEVPQIRAMTLGNRKIGLGVMGWAEMLIQLGIPYQSQEALHLAEMLMQFINRHSFLASIQLARERGTFPNWKKSNYAARQLEIRNATRTSIAPTGSISILANTSSSIEPLFALAYQRQNVLNDQTLLEVNQLFVAHLKSQHLYTDTLMGEIVSSGNLKQHNNLPESTKNLFKTSLEIPYPTHLRHQ